MRACGFCHLADGSGRPENAPVSGLPVAYFIQQMEDFKNGLRDNADPGKNNTNNMIRSIADVVDSFGLRLGVSPYGFNSLTA